MRDFLQMWEMCIEKERDGERYTPKYLKKKTRSMGEWEISKGGKELTKDELVRWKNMYLHLQGLRKRKLEESQEETRERSDWKREKSEEELIGL